MRCLFTSSNSVLDSLISRGRSQGTQFAQHTLPPLHPHPNKGLRASTPRSPSSRPSHHPHHLWQFSKEKPLRGSNSGFSISRWAGWSAGWRAMDNERKRPKPGPLSGTLLAGLTFSLSLSPFPQSLAGAFLIFSFTFTFTTAPGQLGKGERSLPGFPSCFLVL